MFLRHLDLADNELEGPVPESLGGLQQLQVLLLHRNMFDGGVMCMMPLHVVSLFHRVELTKFSSSSWIRIIRRSTRL